MASRSTLEFYLGLGVALLLCCGIAAITGMTQVFLSTKEANVLASMKSTAVLLELDPGSAAAAELRDALRHPDLPEATARRLRPVVQAALAEEATPHDLHSLSHELDQMMAETAEHASRRSLLVIWLTVLFLLLGVFAYLRAYHQLYQYYQKPLRRLTARLRIASDNSNALLRLNPQDNPDLKAVAELCNALIEARVSTQEDARARVEKGYQAIHRLLDAFPEPAVLLTSSRELLADNPPAKALFDGEGGQALYAHFLDALRQDLTMFDSHGVRFEILTPAAKIPNPSNVEVYLIRRS